MGKNLIPCRCSLKSCGKWSYQKWMINGYRWQKTDHPYKMFPEGASWIGGMTRWNGYSCHKTWTGAMLTLMVHHWWFGDVECHKHIYLYTHTNLHHQSLRRRFEKTFPRDGGSRRLVKDLVRDDQMVWPMPTECHSPNAILKTCMCVYPKMGPERYGHVYRENHFSPGEIGFFFPTCSDFRQSHVANCWWSLI